MTSAAPKSSPHHKKPPAAISWRSWPLVDERPRSLGLLGLIAGAGGVVGYATRDPRLAALAVAALLLAAWRLWAPVTYELSPKGVGQRIRSWRRLPWHAVGRYEASRDGLLLHFDLSPGPDNAWHTLFLPCHQRRQEVEAIVEYYLSGRTPPGSTVKQPAP